MKAINLLLVSAMLAKRETIIRGPGVRLVDVRGNFKTQGTVECVLNGKDIPCNYLGTGTASQQTDLTQFNFLKDEVTASQESDSSLFFDSFQQQEINPPEMPQEL